MATLSDVYEWLIGDDKVTPVQRSRGLLRRFREVYCRPGACP